MGETLEVTVDPAIYDGNVRALLAVLPESAVRIRSAEPPPSLARGIGRDGSTTFFWTDETGRRAWLGRTTLPSIRGEALAEAFQPGNGNVLVYGFGQGSTIERLLARMGAHQAVFVIEQAAWMAAAAFRLRDFSNDIARRRLLIFTGTAAWQDCRSFLGSHPGFLTPERMLSWPWFDRETVAMLTDRLSEIQRGVAHDRNRTEPATPRDPAAQPADRPAAAVLSWRAEARIHDTARRICAAAERLGWTTRRFVLDDPAMAHPHAVEASLHAFRPNMALLLGVAPAMLPYRLPQSAVFILCEEDGPLSEEWLKQVPASACLGVRTGAQRKQAVRLGLAERRVLIVPPAAMPAGPNTGGPRGRRILLLGEDGDLSAEAAGLHLPSHRSLWKTATEIITERADTYHDEDAVPIVEEAERRLGFRLENREVRHGIAERVRRRLGSVLVSRACREVLSEAGAALDLIGREAVGGPLSARGATVTASPNAEPTDAPAAYGLLVSLDTAGRVRPALQDGVARGLPAFVRAHPSD
ncbi:MAG: hypothetical protein ACE5E1_11035, partial [Phycisphaerae bacterium]